jgi:dipeptidyl aminopeptidase/acylaminoacyl peptidase
MKTLISWFTFFLILFCVDSKASIDQLEHLFDYSEYQNAKISPDGKYIALSIIVDNKLAIAFLERSTYKTVGSAKLPGNLEVGSFFWVNNERIVIAIAERKPWLEVPQLYGELFAINFDGSKAQNIYGYRAGEMQTGSHLKKKKSIRGWGEIIDRLPNDKENILISSTPMSKTGERLPSVYKLNVYSGKMQRKILTSKIPNAHFLVDNKGEVRAYVGTNKNNVNQLYLKKQNEWQALPQDIVSGSVIPLSISASGKHLYTIDNSKQDLTGIFKLNLDNYSYKSIYTDKVVNITDVEMTTDQRSAYAIRVDDGYPSYLILNKKVTEAQVFKKLLKIFPYREVNITSKTDDGNFYVVLVSSDISNGSLYLYDNKKSETSLLFELKPKLKTIHFTQVEPIKFKASDGKLIHGYFTPAKVKDKTNIAPLVIFVHGGPHGVRDYWGFSDKVHYLSQHGYSILQVNYRGSGGYGHDFLSAGYQVWGTKIQQDILDGYQWLISQNKAEANKACIMGGSFGAYSAIQSVAKYPNTYKCAIANAGIYDLELMFEEGDVQERRAGMSYLTKVLGTNSKHLKSTSPVNYVDRIKVPLLLAHGKKDRRAPFEHAERLRDALEKANKPYEWYVMDKEGHGFYNPENKKIYMKKVVSFLNENLM